MNRRRRTLVSVGLAISTGAALLATAGSAIADDAREKPVLRIVTVDSTHTGCPNGERDAAGQSGTGADSL
ncbi:MAG: hypothetical protein GEV03_26190 [Streptosporangiales bacterium]|nr:hypothetical protein [Streptosporangiales bacterium]